MTGYDSIVETGFSIRSVLHVVSRTCVVSSACLVAFIAVCTVSVASVNATNLIYPIEDYDVSSYVDAIHKCLENKLVVKSNESKDWVLISFVINRNGTISNTTISNSTGNKTFNKRALNILRSTKLSALPHECPEKVKATHAFGWEKAVEKSQDSTSQQSKEEEREHQDTESAADNASAHKTAKEILKGICDITGSSYQPGQLANLEALINIFLNLGEISWYLLLAWLIFGGVSWATSCFLIAGLVWWLHRMFLGKFPE